MCGGEAGNATADDQHADLVKFAGFREIALAQAVAALVIDAEYGSGRQGRLACGRASGERRRAQGGEKVAAASQTGVARG